MITQANETLALTWWVTIRGSVKVDGAVEGSETLMAVAQVANVAPIGVSIKNVNLLVLFKVEALLHSPVSFHVLFPTIMIPRDGGKQFHSC